MDEWINVGETACKTETDKYFDSHKNQSKIVLHLISLIQCFSQSRNQNDINLVVEFMMARRVTPYFLNQSTIFLRHIERRATPELPFMEMMSLTWFKTTFSKIFPNLRWDFWSYSENIQKMLNYFVVSIFSTSFVGNLFKRGSNVPNLTYFV